jgi:hypothetical protein
MKTVLTYGNASEAEVDKSMLESEGMVVYLLNRNSPWNSWGGPFAIQLRVDDENVKRAADLIRAACPSRFGNQARANEAGDAFLRGARRFLWSVVSSIAGLFVIEVIWNPNHVDIGRMVAVNLVLGVIVGFPIWLIYEGIRKIANRG